MKTKHKILHTMRAHLRGALRVIARRSCTTWKVATLAAALEMAAAPGANAACGRLIAWGDDSYSQVSGTPAGAFSAVDAGYLHSVGLRTDGTLISWGTDQHGQVSDTPSGTFSAVSAGNDHTVGLRTDGTLASWGYDGSAQVSGTPSGTFLAISAGVHHNVGLRTDGSLDSWGNNDYGQVSDTPSGTFSAISAGGYHTVGLRPDGTLVSWGNNEYGQVSDTPSGAFSAVAAGDLHIVALRTDGTLISWGNNGLSQVSGTPLGTFSAISAGGNHSMGLRTDGTLVSWGYDGYGQVSGTPNGVIYAISAGYTHSLAIADSIPTLTCPSDFVVPTPDGGGAIVNYPPVAASDDCSTPEITYSQNSGTLFPPGVTTVSVTATDSAGNSTQCSFRVRVGVAAPRVTNNDDSGAGSLRQALAEAFPGDTIDFDPSVTGAIVLTSGQLVIDKSISIRGPGAAILAVDGNSASRVFLVQGGVTATISGLTITRGQAYSDLEPLGDWGGGILNDGSMLTVRHCTVSGNSAVVNGGGIATTDTSRSARNTLSIENSTVSDNSAGFHGGGIYGPGPISIVNSTFSGNSTRSGSGGGIYGFASLTIHDSTFSGNSAIGGGGAIRFQTSPVYVFSISNSSFNGNSAFVGGGLYLHGVSSLHRGAMTLKGTILKAGPSGENIRRVGLFPSGGELVSLGYNLSSDNGGGFLSATGDQIHTDPLLGSLRDNGGPTFTHALLPGSPALDAGDPAFDAAHSPYDQRGTGFPRVANGRVDIGAFEAQIPNAAPSVSCPPPSVLDCAPSAGLPLAVQASVSDPDIGQTLTIKLKQGADVLDTRMIPTPVDNALVIFSTHAFPPGIHPFTIEVDDGAQTTACDTIATVNADLTSPEVTCPADVTVTTTSADGMVVNFPAATASDSCSTPTITYSQPSGSVFNLGTTTVTVTATDAQSNSTPCSFTVRVLYSWSGVLQPINADGSSVFKAGSTVAVKFQLTGASAGIANAVARLGYAKISDSVPGPVNEASATSNSTTGSQFQYDATTGQYKLNWNTKDLSSGTYQLTITLGDGATRTINVALR